MQLGPSGCKAKGAKEYKKCQLLVEQRDQLQSQLDKLGKDSKTDLVDQLSKVDHKVCEYDVLLVCTDNILKKILS